MGLDLISSIDDFVILKKLITLSDFFSCEMSIKTHRGIFDDEILLTDIF